MGLRWLSLMWLVRIPWAGSGPYPSSQSWSRRPATIRNGAGATRRLPTGRARCCVSCAAARPGTVVVADRTYATLRLLAACQRWALVRLLLTPPCTPCRHPGYLDRVICTKILRLTEVYEAGPGRYTGGLNSCQSPACGPASHLLIVSAVARVQAAPALGPGPPAAGPGPVGEGHPPGAQRLPGFGGGGPGGARVLRDGAPGTAGVDL